ncbi:MAG: small multi-drug export protein, partial [Oscillospiraceae bacterium]|nr:small multi-drug export protein [Oscillospiraceae bacterium]
GLLERLERRVEEKKDLVLRYQFWGLLLLVAVPLPGTGAWTGAMVAAVMDLRMKRSMPAIFAGVLIAAAIVTAITMGLFAL